MITGRVVFVSKGYPGTYSELKIMHRELLPFREPGERFLADNYFTDEEFYVTARFGSEARRKKIRQHRCLVERRISGLKNFGVLAKAWRGKVEEHHSVMQTVCQLTNLTWQK